MEISHKSLAPIHCASTDSKRLHINALHFDKEGQTVATDGHILAVAIPATPTPLEPFDIEVAQLADINREQRKKRSDPMTLDADETNANGHAHIRSGTFGTVHQLSKANLAFPDWRMVHKDSFDTHHEVGISAAVLEAMIATVRQYTQTRKGDGQCIRFQFPESNLDCMRATVEDADGGRLEISFMPMRLA